MKIVNNEFYAGDDNWDVETVGTQIKLRRGPGDIALQIRVSPPHAITVEKINMEFEGWFLKGNEEILSFSQDGKNWSTLQGFVAKGSQVGISLG
ncbi:hypothetical protein [Pseudomonas viridiflava]|uniref:hypothetical protein n=1 Tax=Pseudomonas viridiflava TaxID=33069 RepID=UPI001F1527D1|nr:hypothetical protein [Pseudomonas viridiflava]